MREDYDAIRRLDAEVLAVSTDTLEGAERAVEFLDLGFPILFDTKAEVVRRYGVYNLLRDRLATPSIFIIDKSGNIRWKYIGRNYADRPSNQQIIAQLEALQRG
ncbi:MAG: peroxiredoxin family protein [Chloroflexi bacterium]|nr:peroxiredoxin family protein [Chloroflexota bacterium]MCI0801907.1 peroxiredoxin family protein [Chloroflexota bacterium]MCI0829880.1 peroxiredoxin family protein [Chloroflexota bacterium]MCI0864067.1 peroxiredoxin family protein [Chloroflexota bacterium]MCI0897927.1 peroxiredoxin family protein [Chloroflexota bacterium]